MEKAREAELDMLYQYVSSFFRKIYELVCQLHYESCDDSWTKQNCDLLFDA